MPAMAITDTNNLCSLGIFSHRVGAGIQPIIGCQMDVAYSGSDCKNKAPLCGPMVFLAQDKQGYENLLKLNTCLYVDKKGQRPHLTNEEIKHHSDGLICLTGGAEGPVGQLICASQTTAGKSLLMTYAEVSKTAFMSKYNAIPRTMVCPKQNVSVSLCLLILPMTSRFHSWQPITFFSKTLTCMKPMTRFCVSQKGLMWTNGTTPTPNTSALFKNRK